MVQPIENPLSKNSAEGVNSSSRAAFGGTSTCRRGWERPVFSIRDRTGSHVFLFREKEGSDFGHAGTKSSWKKTNEGEETHVMPWIGVGGQKTACRNRNSHTPGEVIGKKCRVKRRRDRLKKKKRRPFSWEMKGDAEIL